MRRCAYGRTVPFTPETDGVHVFFNKAETINRLLKKKSGTRNRRNPLASAEDRTPATHTGNGTPAEGEVEEDESGEAALTGVGAAAPVVEVIPTRYRWISTLKPSSDAPPGDKMFLSFSVPASLLPTIHQSATGVDADGDAKMETTQEQELPEKPRAMAPAVCDVEGCSAKRKYRLVLDWERGACGMDHLHVLEQLSGAIAV
jgi:Ino eighty subunit 2